MRRRGTIYQISEAPKRLTDDVARRQRKYMMSMGIRIVIFVIAAFVPLPLIFRLVLMLGALVIPYVAVVYANGGREPGSPADSLYQPPGPAQLGWADTALGGQQSTTDGDVGAEQPTQGAGSSGNEWAKHTTRAEDLSAESEPTGTRHTDPPADRRHPHDEEARRA